MRAVSEPDAPLPIGVLPEAKQGWMGFPGIAGHRDGRGAFADVRDVVSEHTPAGDAGGFAARSPPAAVDVSGRPRGDGRDRASAERPAAHSRHLRNDGDGDYRLDGLDLALPIPGRATELLDLSGRHNGERRPQRRHARRRNPPP